MKNRIISIILIVFLGVLLMSGTCKKKKVDNCDVCISAQQHLFQRLLTYGCDSEEPEDARTAVYNDCDGTKVVKVSYLEDVCNEGGTPDYNCD